VENKEIGEAFVVILLFSRRCLNRVDMVQNVRYSLLLASFHRLCAPVLDGITLDLACCINETKVVRRPLNGDFHAQRRALELVCYARPFSVCLDEGFWSAILYFGI
jgi:hypothetical protein